MKRIMTILMILVLAMSLCCLPATAAETEVSTADELVAALTDGGTVVLAADIELADFIDIQTDTVLDLNGHTLSVAEGGYSASLMSRYEQDVIIRDSAGGGAIKDDDGYITLSVERGTLTVEGGHIQNLQAHGGDVTLSGGTIDTVQFDGGIAPLTITCGDATVSKWICGKGTVDFDPTAYLQIGYEVKNNGDGTYTIDTVMVEKTGETITVFLDGYDEEIGGFRISVDGQVPDALNATIPVVNDGEPEVIPMTRCDEEGMLWEAQIDKAYIGASIYFVNEAAGIATPLTTVPDKSGMTFNADSEWVAPPEDEPSDEGSSDGQTSDDDSGETPDKGPGIWVWLIPVVAAVVIAAVVVVLLLRKKKA